MSFSMPSPLGVEPPLKRRIIALLDSGDYHDFEITCNGQTWNVHRAIIFPSCRFFKKCLESSMKARTPFLPSMNLTLTPSQEGSEQRVDLPEDSPDAVAGLLYFLYTDEYPSEISGKLLTVKAGLAKNQPDISDDWDEWGLTHWRFDYDLFKLAHRLEITGLANRAKAQLEDVIAAPMKPAWRIPCVRGIAGLLSLAEDLQKDEIGRKFPGLLPELFRTYSQLLAMHIEDSRISSWLDRNPSFNRDIIKNLAKKLTDSQVKHR